MTSIGPYSESRDYKFMFDLPDLRGSTQSISGCGNSVLDYIKKNKDYSGFLHIVKTAQMEDKFGQNEFNTTVFVPMDKYLNMEKVLSIDQGLARSIVEFSMLRRRIDSTLLKANPASYFITEYKELPNLLVINIKNQTTINGCSTILKSDIKLSNGLIHIVDNILIPYPIV